MRVFFTLMLLMGSFCSLAQTLQLPEAKDAIIKADTNNSVMATLNFKLLDRRPGTKVNIRVKDFNDGDAALGKDYIYLQELPFSKLITDTSSQEFKIQVKVFPLKSVVKQKYFNLYITFSRENFPITEKFKAVIDYSKTQPKSEIDTSKWSVNVITGSNLDFFNTPVFKNFAGELKVWVPSFAKLKTGKKNKIYDIGIDFGIFNYQYFEADSSNGNFQTQNILLSPTGHPVVDSSKYIRNISAINSNFSYNNWGIYLNPIHKVSGNEWYDLFYSLHFEFIWRKTITKNSLVALRNDTLTINSGDISNRSVFSRFQGLRPLYGESNYFDFYLGIGLPIKIRVKNAAELFLNPAFGFTNFSIINTKTEIENDIRIRSFAAKNVFVPFFLNKFQIKTTVAPVDIVVGGEFRIIAKKQLDKSPAYKAFYLGAVIPLDKIKK